MTEVTVIGLGLMGSALARALVRAGHKTIVWNRTASRAAPLIAEGVGIADSLKAAIEASSLVIVCIDNYQSTLELLSPASVSAALNGRTLVQFSTGTPKEARELEQWTHSHGAAYVDGAIMAFPDSIGRDETLILVAGAEQPFRRSEPCLKCLGGNLRYVGPQAGGAATLDFAILSYTLGSILASYWSAPLGWDRSA